MGCTATPQVAQASSAAAGLSPTIVQRCAATHICTTLPLSLHWMPVQLQGLACGPPVQSGSTAAPLMKLARISSSRAASLLAVLPAPSAGAL